MLYETSGNVLERQRQILLSISNEGQGSVQGVSAMRGVQVGS